MVRGAWCVVGVVGMVRGVLCVVSVGRGEAGMGPCGAVWACYGAVGCGALGVVGVGCGVWSFTVLQGLTWVTLIMVSV